MKQAFLRIKDPFCGVSHGLGIVLSVVALVSLLAMARGSAPRLLAFTIYGASLITLYTASTFYHSLRGWGFETASCVAVDVAIDRRGATMKSSFPRGRE